MLNTNSWNRIRYSMYQPFYDIIAGYFRTFRSTSIKGLKLRNEDKILILGAGTGLDLEYLKEYSNITAVDITPSMLTKLKHRTNALGIRLETYEMDAANLDFPDNHFDAVILHLIVAVIPNPIACLQETERVLKPGGKFTIMDKFVRPNTTPSILRQLANPITTFLATTVNRDIDKLLSSTTLKKEVHIKLGSIFWLIQGSKINN